MNMKRPPHSAKISSPGLHESRKRFTHWLRLGILVGAAALFAVSIVTLVPHTRAAGVAGDRQHGTRNSDVPKPEKAPRRNLSSRAELPAGVTQAAPANDNCANAIEVTPAILSFSDTQNTTAATDETGEPQSNCTTQGKSVWYSYANMTANDVSVTVDTCSSNFDTALMVWEQTGAQCDFTTFVARSCNDDFCGDGFQSQTTFLAEAGKTYKIQSGGFDGETGNLTTKINSVVFACPGSTIHGTLGSGSPDHSFATGNQTGRLNRNGVASSCAVPKACNIFATTGARAFDAYTFPNLSGTDACIMVTLDVTTPTGANYGVDAYLDSFDPANICTNYLADPGLSSGGGPQTPISMSFTVPGRHSVVLVVHTVNEGETAGNYTLSIQGNLCIPPECARLVENFDGVTAPALPAGWASTSTAGAANCTPSGTCALGTNWVTDAATPDTAPNDAFHNDPSCVTDSVLDTL